MDGCDSKPQTWGQSIATSRALAPDRYRQGANQVSRKKGPTGVVPNRSVASARLLELENEVVAFADGDVLVAIFITHCQCGRQGPNALGPVLGVAGIGVDF